MRLTAELTDSAILAEIGRRLERRRINANLTQAQLADEAGIAKRTLERLESGASAEFVTLVRGAARARGDGRFGNPWFQTYPRARWRC